MKNTQRKDCGFSIAELAVVMAAVLTIGMIAIPSIQNTLAAYRGSTAARKLSSQLQFAKMRSGANFTRARVHVDTTNNTFQIDTFDKTSTTCCWINEGGVHSLGTGVSFGFGSIAAPPAGTQSAIQLSTDIVFSSRGIPVVDGADTVFGDYAFYINSDGDYFAVTVSITGLIQTWKYRNSVWTPL